jgi:hypothetical protein
MAPTTADVQQSTENISRQNQLLSSDEARVQKSEQNLEEGGGVGGDGSSISFGNEGGSISETLS